MHKQRHICLVLICFLALLLFAVIPAYADAPWSGNGTAGNPYRIGSEADLRALADEVNSGNSYAKTYFMLTEDFSAGSGGWTPIGSSKSLPFDGVFDGEDHTITLDSENDASYQGLFGVLTGTVRNLTVNVHVTGGDYVGGIAAYCCGTIADCSVQGSVTGSSYVGGIVGYLGPGSSITECESGAAVTGEGTAIGGVVGAANNIPEHSSRFDAQAAAVGSGSGTLPVSSGSGASSGTNGTISDCDFTKDGVLVGTAPASSDDPEYNETTGVMTIPYYDNAYGGIVGWSNGFEVTGCRNLGSVTGGDFTAGIVGDSTNGGTIKNSYNGGTVTGSGRLTGGIAGRINQGLIENCANHETVNGGDFTGGIVGFADKESRVNGSYTSSTGEVTGSEYVGGVMGIANCAVNGLRNMGKVSGLRYTGGIVGYTTKDVVGCETTSGASVSAVSSGGSAAYGLGGIVGYASAGISNCKNLGAVKGAAYTGGVAGYVKRDAAGCSNTGSVEGSDRVGGVAGYVAGTAENCTNDGAVRGTNYVGGVVGLTEGSLNKCSNAGEVNGSLAFVGGVAGMAGGAVSCTNTGKVFCPSVSGGGIAGAADGAVSSCINTGSVTAAGGLAGGIAGAASENAPIDGCLNIGAVSGGSLTGGIAGIANREITDCTNKGTIVGSDGFTGGIAGANAARVTDCSNSGAVSGVWRTGGIVGSCYEDASVSGCDNTGTVTGTGEKTGGIAGATGGNTDDEGDDGSALISGCVNSGKVAGKDLTGGVVGYLTGESYGCSNSGEVTGARFTGGIAGHAKNGLSSMVNEGAVRGGNFSGGIAGNSEGPVEGCVNKNAVTGTGENTGGIAGASTGDVSNCVNSGAVSGVKYVGGITGINANCSVTDCVNRASVSGTSSYVGGITGFSNGGTLSACVNENKNTTVSSSAEGETYVGGIVGYNNGPILSCRNEASVSGASASAGVAGYCLRGAVTSCTNNGSVTGKSYTGGIIGTAYMDNNPVAITYCENNGTINGGTNSHVGGIAGKLSARGSFIDQSKNTGSVTGGTSTGGIAGDTYEGAKISNSTNYGSVAMTGESKEDVGGIVGYTNANLYNCINNGSVTAPGSAEDVAGIVGFFAGKEITKCANNGSVAGGWQLIGGITGYARGVTISECKNTNNVGSGTDRGIYVGGIVGDSRAGTVMMCENSGSVQGIAWVGGVVGFKDNSGAISQCRNLGSVYGGKIPDEGNVKDFSYTGGIVGLSEGGTTDQCANRGTVSAAGKCVGGVAGMASSEDKVSNSYNVAAVRGMSNVGGVVGWLRNSIMEKCYNYSSPNSQPTANDNSWGKLAGSHNGGALINNAYTDSWGDAIGWNKSTTTVSRQFEYFLNSSLADKDKIIEYCDWDFTNIWTIGQFSADKKAPCLRFEGAYRPGAVSEPSGTGTDGSGVTPALTAEEDYYIRNADDLRAFRNAVNNGNTFAGRTVYLCADIDLDGENWTPIGNNTAFAGTFKGQSHIVSGIAVNSGVSADPQGFFGVVAKEGTVEDLAVCGSIASESSFTGGIVGLLNGKLQRCSFSGEIDVPRGVGVGGLAGQVSNTGSITDCRHSGPVNGGLLVGGVAGVSSGSIRTSCHADGAITTAIHEGDGGFNGVTGGVAGGVSGKGVEVIACYSLDEDAANAIGGRENNPTIRDVEVLTPLQMRDMNRYTDDWDWYSVWGIGSDAPELRQFCSYVNLMPNGVSGFASAWIPRSGGHLPVCPFKRNGYVFTGWNTKADGSGTRYADGAAVNGELPLYLYAQWTKGTRYDGYIIESSSYLNCLFDNGATDGTVNLNTTINFFTKDYVRPSGFALTASAAGSVTWKLEAKGYEADEWTVIARGDVSGFTAGQKTVFFPVDDAGEYCYYRFSPTVSMISRRPLMSEMYLIVNDPSKDVRPPMISFDSHDGSGTMTPQTGTNRSWVNLKENEFSRSGYRFYRWSTLPEDGGTQYTDRQRFRITEDVTLYAQWRELTYEIRFVDEGGEPLYTENMKAGKFPVYKGVPPVKDPENGHTFAFSGWSPEVAPVNGEATYRAQYEEKAVTYTVTWYDGNGDELYHEDVEYGKTPAYSGDTPTKDKTAKFSFTFNDTWSPEITAVAGPAQYTAQFDETVNKYKITWLDGDGQELYHEEVEYDATPAYSGDTPTKTGSAEITYVFNNTWSPEISPVTGEAEYTAQFGTTTNSYTVTWYDGDGNVLYEEQVPCGETPEYTGKVPTKTAEEGSYYVFTGRWSPEIEPVTGDAEYTAIFTDRPNVYKVTWLVNGSTVIELYEYGDMPSHPVPSIPALPTFTFVFEGWSPEIVPVTEDAVYTAVFRMVLNPFNPFFPKTHTNDETPPDESSSLPFADVEPLTPLYDDVKYVYDRGIMNGVSETEFDPDGPLTRGMIVTILYRMEGEPSVSGVRIFRDVPVGEWYSDAVEWAASVGIVKGYGKGDYGPNDELTREQLAAILERYADHKQYGTDAAELDASVSDSSEISDWAEENVKWAASSGILTADENGKLRPAEPATRAEIALAVRAFLENVAK